ncbi:retrovirus-related Pol polyprotein from transposon 17.6 [Trichonephila clavipes]|nr:retrovirus-related Pol polyprotein from transposon 17.6 [Trichonephila clavipes]
MEERHPQTTSSILQLVDNYEERFLNRITRGPSHDFRKANHARMISSQTGIGMRIGEIRKLKTDAMTLANHRGKPTDLQVKVLDFLIKDVNCGSSLCSNTFERNVHHSPVRYRSRKVIYIRRGLLQILSYRPRQRTKDRFVTGQGAPCFHIDKPGLTHVLYHDIDSGDQEPVVSRPYRYDRVKQRIIEYHIQKMLKKGTVWPMQSQYTSTVVLTCHNYFLPPHYPEAYRFVTDYRKLNAITKFSRYSLPLIDELITNIPFMTIMSKLDLRSVESLKGSLSCRSLTLNGSISLVLRTSFADILSRNLVDNVEGSQISHAALRALALNSREQSIQEQREDPELGHIHPNLENSVLEVQNNNLTIWKSGRRITVKVDQVQIYHEPLQRTRMTTGGVEEYEDRQPTTEQAQEKEPQCGSIRDGDPADRST